jgi:CRP/FNR family transcriptional regulator
MMSPYDAPETSGVSATDARASALATTLCARFPRLAQLSPAALAEMVRAGKHLVLPAGVRVFDEHGPCGSFPLVLTGAIKVFKHSPSGRQLVLYRVLPGELCVLTTSCLLGEASYAASGATEGETELLALGAPLFNNLLAHCGPFRTLVFSIFSERIVDLMRRVEEVAFQRLDRRLASLLVARAPEVRATHQDLADELGSVREIVSRLLKSFEEQGFVGLGRERVEVKDVERLRRFAEEQG